MMIFNTVIPHSNALLHIFTFQTALYFTRKRCQQHKTRRQPMKSDNKSLDMLLQIFDVIQLDVALSSQVHQNIHYNIFPSFYFDS